MKSRKLFGLLLNTIILCAIITVFIYKIIPAYEQSYSASLADKVDRLESLNEPKIVLIGNSNLAFGIDSEKIEQEMKMPVVNMGLHGAIGNAFHEEMAKVNITPGDIYVISHTDYSDNGAFGDSVLAWTAIENNWNLYGLLKKQDIPVMKNAFPTYLKKCIKRWEEGTSNEIPSEEYYRRSSFNSYGDIKTKRNHSMLDELEIDVGEYCPEISNICVNRLNELNSYIQERGASMVVAAYPIIVKEAPSTAFLNELEAFQTQLEEQLTCPVISHFSDYCYDENYFFDTIYHLTDAGAGLRTEQLIKDLRSI